MCYVLKHTVLQTCYIKYIIADKSLSRSKTRCHGMMKSRQRQLVFSSFSYGYAKKQQVRRGKISRRRKKMWRLQRGVKGGVPPCSILILIRMCQNQYWVIAIDTIAIMERAIPCRSALWNDTLSQILRFTGFYALGVYLYSLVPFRAFLCVLVALWAF